MSIKPTLSTTVFVYILELWKYVMILPDYSFKKKKKKKKVFAKTLLLL